MHGKLKQSRFHYLCNKADLVIEAIKYGGSKSVSFPSIKKYLGEKYDVDRLFYIKKSMKQLLEDDIIYNKTKGMINNIILLWLHKS